MQRPLFFGNTLFNAALSQLVKLFFMFFFQKHIFSVFFCSYFFYTENINEVIVYRVMMYANSLLIL